MGESEAIRGEAVARQLFGDARYERSRREGPPTHRGELLRLADEVVFGMVYPRPGLPLEQRALCTIAALTVLGRAAQLRAHIDGALNIGVADESIVETITQMAVYGGFPAALNAMDVADEAFAARHARVEGNG